MPRCPASLRWLLAGALALAGLGVTPAVSATRAGPPVDPAALQTWWRAAARIQQGDTAYRVKAGTTFEDGVCSFRFDEGIFVPVRTGQAPVSEKIVGFVFVGKGQVRMRFPDRADAESFANHMTLRGGADPAAMAKLARGGRTWDAPITRGLFLSADERLHEVLYGLEPMGSGTVLASDEEGVDEVYMVTDSRGALKAKVVATNILPQRRNQLLRAGFDPYAQLRQDRLLNEELGVPEEELRLLADVRTDSSLRVASGEGKAFGNQDYDQWLTCYRDGGATGDTGYRAMAFAQGTDTEGRHHFQRFSGERFVEDPVTGAVKPARSWVPVDADVQLSTKAIRMGNYYQAEATSTMTLRAQGGDLRHVTMALPAEGVADDDFNVLSLEVVDAKGDARPVAWSMLSADLSLSGSADPSATRSLEEQSDPTITDVDVDTTGSADGLTAGAVAPDTSGVDLDASVPQEAVAETEAIRETPNRIEIIALLPDMIPVGGDVTLRMKWRATWPYANWSNAGRPLGPTTGLQSFLPELLPAPGGTAWNYTLRLEYPGIGLRTIGVVASGDTIEEGQDENSGWRWLVSRGVGARHPAVAVGRWNELDEQGTLHLPAVRVRLFASESAYLPQFPAELRRTVAFLDGFLPDFPLHELEVFQGASTFMGTALSRGFHTTAYGLVGVQTVATSEVGEDTALRNEDPHLAQTMIARQVAAQYWGQLIAPASGRDAWISEALADTYAAFYVRAAFGKTDYNTRVTAVRKGLERPVERENRSQVNDRQAPYSLTGATDYSDVPERMLADYGFYVLAEMLRFRVGDQAFFSTLDWLAADAAGQRVTTERLQAAFEASSGQDLQDFFDTWIHGGWMPSLEAQVRTEQRDGGTYLYGCLTADVPFATYDVPVRVSPKADKGKKKAKSDEDRVSPEAVGALVKVHNGRGSFEIPNWTTGEPIVELDPDGLVLARARKVSVVTGKTSCETGSQPSR